MLTYKLHSFLCRVSFLICHVVMLSLLFEAFTLFGPFKLTLGVFFSVFRLTKTGLSYLTREEFGGIMID